MPCHYDQIKRGETLLPLTRKTATIFLLLLFSIVLIFVIVGSKQSTDSELYR